MRKRFSRSILNKLTGHEPSKGEVASSHAFGRISRSSSSIPRTRRGSPAERRAVASYRDSMVGSTVQYRDRLPVAPPAPPAKEKNSLHENVVGNRPQSKMTNSENSKIPSAPPRSFVEPPKRSFNPYD